MKILLVVLLLGALSWVSGCASIGPPQTPSLELPKEPTDLRAARKGDKVTLTWSVPLRTTDRQSVKYLGKTQICRGLDAVLTACKTPVGSAAPPADFISVKKDSGKKLAASFVDTLPSALEQEHSAGFATYAVEVLNTAGRGAGISNQVHVALVPTLAPFADFSAQVGEQGVTLSWHCPETNATAGVKYLFRIYRRSADSSSQTKIAEIDVTDCAVGPLNSPGRGKVVTSFLDQTFEWEKTYLYRGTVVSVVGKPVVEVEGNDTPEVKVFAHDVFPPKVPSGLQAVFSGPGQQPFIDLIWAPVTDADLDGYNIYRHEEGATVVKLNGDPVRTPAFRDEKVAAGKTYFYSVSGVDVRGNESGRSEEASESVP